MAKKNSLQSLIDDLDYLEKNFDTLFSKEMDNIIARLLVNIGKTTAYDTGLVRDLLKQMLIELGRVDLLSELEYQVYEFWKTRNQRELEGSNKSFSIKKGNGSREYNITIEDEGFYNQQQGIVSKTHPRHDPNVIPYNVNLYLDKLETGGDKDMDKAIDEFRNAIIDFIEKGR